MTPEEKTLLENTFRLAKENNDMLRSVQRQGRISLTFRVLYWVLIIGLSLGAFYFVQPYIEILKGLTGNGTSNSDYGQQIQNLLK